MGRRRATIIHMRNLLILLSVVLPTMLVAADKEGTFWRGRELSRARCGINGTHCAWGAVLEGTANCAMCKALVREAAWQFFLTSDETVGFNQDRGMATGDVGKRKRNKYATSETRATEVVEKACGGLGNYDILTDKTVDPPITGLVK